MQINNIDILSSMDEQGAYTFAVPAIARNGRGAAVLAPYATLNWRFDVLTLAQYAWWCTTLLGGAASAEYTQCKLFNHLGVLTTYVHCTVQRPTYEKIQDGLLYGVNVLIDWIY